MNTLCNLWDLTDSPGTELSSLRSNFTGFSRFTGWQFKSQAKCQSQERSFQRKKTDCIAGNLKQTTVQTGTSRTVVGDTVGLPETLFRSGEETFCDTEACRNSCFAESTTCPFAHSAVGFLMALQTPLFSYVYVRLQALRSGVQLIYLRRIKCFGESNDPNELTMTLVWLRSHFPWCWPLATEISREVMEAEDKSALESTALAMEMMETHKNH